MWKNIIEIAAIYISHKGNHNSIKYNLINLMHSTQYRTDNRYSLYGWLHF